jgi:hypothetical protein
MNRFLPSNPILQSAMELCPSPDSSSHLHQENPTTRTEHAFSFDAPNLFIGEEYTRYNELGCKPASLKQTFHIWHPSPKRHRCGIRSGGGNNITMLRSRTQSWTSQMNAFNMSIERYTYPPAADAQCAAVLRWRLPKFEALGPF